MDKNVHLISKTGEKIVVPHNPAEKATRLAKLYARSLINKKGYNGQEL